MQTRRERNGTTGRNHQNELIALIELRGGVQPSEEENRAPIEAENHSRWLENCTQRKRLGETFAPPMVDWPGYDPGREYNCH